MKNLIFKLLIGSNILLMNPVHATAKPFAYSAEKDGKIIHLLGTMHFSVSIEELPCSNEILDLLNTSDLIFAEVQKSDLILFRHLGDNTRRFLTASADEREKILNTLSEKERKIVSQIFESYNSQINKMIPRIFNIRFIDKEREPFEALNPEFRNLLINHGVDIHGSYVDHLHSLFKILSFKGFSGPQLDFFIAEIALSQNISIKSLDDNEKLVIGDLMDVLSPQSENASEMEKPEMEINSDMVNAMATRFLKMTNNDAIIALTKQLKQLYLSGKKEDVLKYAANALNDKAKELLLKKRNELWFQKLKEAFESHEYQNIFFAGGVVHLLGPFNILDMLEEEGFIIQRLTCSSEN